MPVLEEFAVVCLSLNSWAPMKELSRAGFDIVKNLHVDYGNRQYRAVLHLWCAVEQRVKAALDLASTRFGALAPPSPLAEAIVAQWVPSSPWAP